MADAEEKKAEEGEADDGKEEKEGWVSRDTWIRGLDLVLPLDTGYGKYCGPVDVLEKLIADGLDVNAPDRCMGLTPLMKAAARNHVEAIKCLIKHGADLNAKDNCGYTALHKCSGKSKEPKYGEYPLYEEARACLLEAGAEDNPEPKKRIFKYSFDGNSYWMDAPEEEA